MKVKNSNKILLLILLLLIAVPMLVAMVLRHKVRNGQFEIVKTNRSEDPRLRQEGTMEGIKAIKLIGPDKKDLPDLFDAVIVNGQQNAYTVKKSDLNDSLRIQRTGDTLVFAYHKGTADGKRRPYFYGKMNLVLSLPANLPVVATNCRVQLASSQRDTSDRLLALPAFVYLKNGAVLEIGDRAVAYKSRPDSGTLAAKAVFILDSADSNQKAFDTTFVLMPDFHIFASNSTVRFIQPLAFKQVELYMQDGSSLELSNPFKTGHLSGQLGLDTEIKGDARGLRSIKALIRD